MEEKTEEIKIENEEKEESKIENDNEIIIIEEDKPQPEEKKMKLEQMELFEEEKKIIIQNPKQLLKDQLQFYFSDSNLPYDKFLKEKVSENEEGCKN